MKLSVVQLVLLIVFTGLSYGYEGMAQELLNKPVSIQSEGSPLRQVIRTIEQQTRVKFVYSSAHIRAGRPVTLHLRQARLSEALEQLLKPLALTYRVINGRIVLDNLELPEAAPPGTIQVTEPVAEREVSGRVTDEKGEPLPAVNVLVKGSTRGTTTQADGTFRLKIPDDATVLVFSFVGYLSREEAVNARAVIDVVLQVDERALNEVVVVGYGVQKKVNLTGAVNSVRGEDLAKRNVATASAALQGLAPGVSVVQSSGRPGADGGVIKIRGTGSINSTSNPLILIDGVEGDINQIDMNSIESISVLKDAASASIYGSRASNGVILITTKRSKKEKLAVTYSGFIGTNSPTDMPEPVSAVEYMEAINVARANSNQTPQYSESIINDYKTLGADGLNRYDTDWRKEVIRNSALMHNNSLSIGGGSESVRFFGNLGMFSQNGNIAHNDYKRFTLRMNTDAQVSKWLKIGSDLNIRSSKARRPSIEEPETIINKATTFVPVFSGINADGTWGYGQNGDNPIATAEAGGVNTAIMPEMMLKGFLVLNPLKGLDISSSYSYRRVETKSDYFISPYDTYEGGVYKIAYPASGNEKSEAWSQTIARQFNLQAAYDRQFKNHALRLLTGMQTEEKQGRSFSASRKGFEFDGFQDLDHGDIATARNSGGHWDWAMLSFFNRLNYSYKERYLVELNGRWDASSRFKADYRWGFFPSASIGWRLSEEPFFRPLKKVVDDFKFRGSYGTLGNQEIFSYFPYAATITPGSIYWFDKQPATGATQTQVANEKISWEKSTQTNFGVDAELFNYRLSMTLDYYIRDIGSMLQQFPIPAYVGLSSPWENAGNMRNTGWDLSLIWRDKIGEVNYRINANLSDVRNKITNLYGKEYIGNQIKREGDPIDSWFGYVFDGYFQSQSEIDPAPVFGEKANVKPGYLRYRDLSGPDGIPDGVINAFDRTIIGNPAPRYEYSLNLGADWKGFDVTVFIQGVGKKEIFYSGNGARPFYIGRSIFRHQLDYWTEDNRDAAFPLLLIDGSGANPNNIISSFWVKSGAYARLKNLVIGYTFPAALTGKAGINKLRLYAGGQNLWTLSNAYKGYDPETSVSGGNFYPLMRTFTFGLDLNF